MWLLKILPTTYISLGWFFPNQVSRWENCPIKTLTAVLWQTSELEDPDKLCPNTSLIETVWNNKWIISYTNSFVVICYTVIEKNIFATYSWEYNVAERSLQTSLFGFNPPDGLPLETGLGNTGSGRLFSSATDPQ